ncbi:CoA-transferase family III [Clathrospora elynae]|uniref:CoA-transferase family III n=1 Tax=Clathrospora elynae TaxID=706981 RepID=A0A6A5SHB8_9PLEO|nr:CoA-transferase family III [Clathrospora elynae]
MERCASLAKPSLLGLSSLVLQQQSSTCTVAISVSFRKPVKAALPFAVLKRCCKVRPYCTQILGDIGWATQCSNTLGHGLIANRNKKSLALAFNNPTDISIFHKLVKQCDVLVENYLPGSLSKYKFDYETLSELNPSLIYASVTGYGQTGPYRDRAGYDVMVEAEMGLMHITGEKDRPPVKVGVAVTDIMTGM